MKPSRKKGRSRRGRRRRKPTQFGPTRTLLLKTSSAAVGPQPTLPPLQRKNARILRDHLDQQLENGSRFLDARLTHFVGGTLGMVLNPLVGILYRYAARGAIEKRARHQLDLLIACALKSGAVEEFLPDYYPTEEAWARADHSHPALPRVERLLRRAFEARVEAVSRLLRAEGTTYRELSRQAIPTRAEAQRLVDEQLDIAGQLLDLLESEPGLIRVPHLIRGEVFRILRGALEWTRENTHRELDAIYI